MNFVKAVSQMSSQITARDNTLGGSSGAFDLLTVMPDTIRCAFQGAVHSRRFSAGQVIYSVGDAGNEMFRIVSGMVRLSVLRDDGREMVLAVLQSGESFGAHDLISNTCRTHMAEAESPVEVQVLNRRAFNALRLAHRSFDEALLRLMTDQLNQLAAYLAAATVDELPNSLARRLLDTARPDAANRLVVRVGQTELALMIGASRQTVNKILRQFESDGLVSLGYRAVTIRNPHALADRVEQVPVEAPAAPWRLFARGSSDRGSFRAGDSLALA
jgi:CRP/FNR family transcriptional regulator